MARCWESGSYIGQRASVCHAGTFKKHGFDFVDANEVFDGVTFTYEDDRIAYGEQGFVTLGSLRGNVVSIVHTEQGDHIRVFSMRKATKRECEIYFQSISN